MEKTSCRNSSKASNSKTESRSLKCPLTTPPDRPHHPISRIARRTHGRTSSPWSRTRWHEHCSEQSLTHFTQRPPKAAVWNDTGQSPPSHQAGTAMNSDLLSRPDAKDAKLSGDDFVCPLGEQRGTLCAIDRLQRGSLVPSLPWAELVRSWEKGATGPAQASQPRSNREPVGRRNSNL
jgi:hypothetical protein